MDLQTLYDLHAKQAQRLAYHLLRNAADADDAVSDALARIAPKLAEIADGEAGKVYLGIVRHVSYDTLRLRRKFDDMTEYEIEETLNSDYCSASNLRERPGSESPIGVDLVQWVKDSCTPAEYGLVLAYLATPDIQTLADDRKVAPQTIYTAFSKLGHRLGRARASLRADYRLLMRQRAEFGQGSRGGKTWIATQLHSSLVSLLSLLDLEGSLVGTNTVKAADGSGRWTTANVDAWGLQCVLSQSAPLDPHQGMLACYTLC